MTLNKLKIKALEAEVNNYVSLIYRFPDGTEVSQSGYIYLGGREAKGSEPTLAGNWIDLEILVRIERRMTSVETVFDVDNFEVLENSQVLDVSCLREMGYSDSDINDMTR